MEALKNKIDRPVHGLRMNKYCRLQKLSILWIKPLVVC